MLYSINFQAICNAHAQFTNVRLRWPGSVHDVRGFTNCNVQKGYSTDKLNLSYQEVLPGHEEVPQLLLDSPAYPMLPYVMSEFNQCTRNEQVSHGYRRWESAMQS